MGPAAAIFPAMDPIALRPRKATEIVDAAVEVYRRNPIQFLLLTALVHVPWMVLQIVFIGNRSVVEALPLELMLSVGAFLTWFLLSGLVIYLASELYLGRDIDAFETVRRMWTRLPAVFVASLVQTLMLFAGLVLFLFPAVWLSSLFFAVGPVVVLEKKGPFAAFDRSAELSKGVKWHVLSALGLIVMIRLLVQGGVLVVVSLLKDRTLQYLVSGVANILIYPLLGITEALIYYDVRIRKEGFDIEMMAAQTAASSAATA
jgi:hypothetical protein